MKLVATFFFAASLLGCGHVCKSEQAVSVAELEAARENEASVARTTARFIRERKATRVDAIPVVLRTQCFTRTPPADDKGTFEGWNESIPVACSDVAAFINRAKPLDAVSASGKRVLIVRAAVENAVTLATAASHRLLLFRAVPYPDEIHVREITQCGQCSGLSDAWAKGPPEERSISAFVLEGWTAASTEWVEFPYEGFEVRARCEERGPE